MDTLKSVEDAPNKREVILAAARVLFAQKGYEETTISDIAREAKIAVGTVYLYFRTKRDVYTAVALDTEALLTAVFQDPALLRMPFREALRAMINALFTVSREYQHVLALAQIDTQSSEEVLQHQKAHQKITQALSDLFRVAIEQGELAPFNTEMYAQMLICAGSDLIHQCFVIEHGEREETFRTSFTEFVDRLFFGPSLHDGYPVSAP